MCLLAIHWRVTPDAPLVVAANREESHDRPGTLPQRVPGPTPFLAGLDPRAGGTWLGLNAHGLLVAVTNGAKSKPPAQMNAQPRSRGLLVRDLLEQHRTAAEAVQHAVKAIETNAYAGCNLFIGDATSVQVVHGGDWLRVLPLPPGIHVMTTGLVNNPHDPRVQFAREWLHEHHYPNGNHAVATLRTLCGLPELCLHGEERGTISSSIIVVRQPLSASAYWHAQGPPDDTPYQDVSRLLRP
jgi:uncharacterized protein with NRDE domain